MKSLRSLALAAATVCFAGPLAAQGPSETPPSRHSVNGQITVINHFSGKVTIKTEDIPGLEGKSMTVGYTPKDTMALKSLHEGDHVKGDLIISGSDTHMENVVAVGTTKHDTAKKTP